MAHTAAAPNAAVLESAAGPSSPSPSGSGRLACTTRAAACDHGLGGPEIRRDDHRVAHDVVGRSDADDLAQIERDQTIGYREQQRDVVLDHEQGCAGLLTD